MIPPDRIKAIAADFLRALATVPGLFARWQSETSPAARAEIVTKELALAAPLTSSDVARMAELTQPLASAATRGLSVDLPGVIVLAHESIVPLVIVLAHENAQAVPA
ncbi:MAG TPA: hypothetical protein VMH02_00070 [Verrucomicrobiae bacterium]|nr:hypothetical protein [Verrucomicrobiae bacterium]